jgi:hypothetical protein
MHGHVLGESLIIMYLEYGQESAEYSQILHSQCCPALLILVEYLKLNAAYILANATISPCHSL